MQKSGRYVPHLRSASTFTSSLPARVSNPCLFPNTDIAEPSVPMMSFSPWTEDPYITQTSTAIWTQVYNPYHFAHYPTHWETLICGDAVGSIPGNRSIFNGQAPSLGSDFY